MEREGLWHAELMAETPEEVVKNFVAKEPKPSQPVDSSETMDCSRVTYWLCGIPSAIVAPKPCGESCQQQVTEIQSDLKGLLLNGNTFKSDIEHNILDEKVQTVGITSTTVAMPTSIPLEVEENQSISQSIGKLSYSNSGQRREKISVGTYTLKSVGVNSGYGRLGQRGRKGMNSRSRNVIKPLQRTIFVSNTNRNARLHTSSRRRRRNASRSVNIKFPILNNVTKISQISRNEFQGYQFSNSSQQRMNLFRRYSLLRQNKPAHVDDLYVSRPTISLQKRKLVNSSHNIPLLISSQTRMIVSMRNQSFVLKTAPIFNITRTLSWKPKFYTPVDNIATSSHNISLPIKITIPNNLKLSSISVQLNFAGTSNVENTTAKMITSTSVPTAHRVEHVMGDEEYRVEARSHEKRGSSTDQLGGNVYILYCQDIGTPRVGNYVSLCGQCRALRTLSNRYFPKWFNQVRCEGKRGCLGGKHGSCLERNLLYQIYENKGTGRDPDWHKVTISLPVCCDCVMDARSRYIDLIEPGVS